MAVARYEEVARAGRVGHLIAREVSVAYGGLKAVDRVSLEVAAGEVVGLIGPNGSGKTSFLNAISGVQTPESEYVEIDGRRIDGLATHVRVSEGLARTFQTLRLFESQTVLENVMLGASHRWTTGYVSSVFRTRAFRRERASMLTQAREALGIFGERLSPREHDKVSTLSYANRRRVEISRAIMARPKVLLLDEPTAGMNPNETLEMAAHLTSLRAVYGISMLVIEHKLAFLEELGCDLYVLDHGVVIAHGGLERIQKDPVVVEAFLGAE